MADNVQWIKLKVGMFDGNSFKKIKRAMIGGVSYRDKLTAVWFELLDLAGKGNSNGYLVDNNEIPYHTFEEIAIMIDRETEEVELCMQFFINEKMVEIIDNIYCLSNFVKYQNEEGLDRIRERKRIAQAKWRERKKMGLIGCVDGKVSTVDTTSNLLSISNISNLNSNNLVNNIHLQDKEKEYKEKESLIKTYDFSERVKESITLWLQYKKEKRQTYQPIGFKQLLTKLKGWANDFGDDYVIEAINSSITNNYAGIFGAKNKQKENSKAVYDHNEQYTVDYEEENRRNQLIDGCPF